MSENNKIGTYRFVAEPFHVDFNGRLTMGVLGNHLLNCAGFHASDRGFGIATLNEDNYTWVLSRLAIELDEMPYQYEEFSVQTWVENVYRLFTDRNFAVINKDGKKIGYARSVWAMINLNTIQNMLNITDAVYMSVYIDIAIFGSNRRHRFFCSHFNTRRLFNRTRFVTDIINDTPSV